MSNLSPEKSEHFFVDGTCVKCGWTKSWAEKKDWQCPIKDSESTISEKSKSEEINFLNHNFKNGICEKCGWNYNWARKKGTQCLGNDFTQSVHESFIPTSDSLKEDKEKPSNNLKGVGGWLLFFCITLTILGPLSGISYLYSNWHLTQSSIFELVPGLELSIWLGSIAVSTLVIYGIFIGVKIWNGIENGKSLALKYLKIKLITIVSLEIITLLMLISESTILSIFIELTLIVIFSELVFFGVWYSYFKKSKRVKNTYAT
jgi:hypothetical protein